MPEASKKIMNMDEEYLVYSGKGGQILKPRLFELGKKFIHAHAGWVPEFRGSTTIYYELLENGNASVSVMFLSPDLDSGDIIGQYSYGAPNMNNDIDMVFEPYIRALSIKKVLLNYYHQGEFDCKTQDETGITYYIIHPVLKHIALLNL